MECLVDGRSERGKERNEKCILGFFSSVVRSECDSRIRSGELDLMLYSLLVFAVFRV